MDPILGGVAVTFGVTIGFVRVFNSSRTFSYDLVPLDVVVNAILVIASQNRQESSKVYNLVSNSGNSFGGSSFSNMNFALTLPFQSSQ